jgi:PAS domain S-box-containing protein
MTPSRRRIMLVEDSPTQAERIRGLLEREGMEVTHVPSAEEALARFESARPDLVLLDFHLPGMNGSEFCREIRLNVNTRAVPVLMLTIESGEVAQTRGLESGADDYVEKSADPDVLLARVRGLLRHANGAAPILGTDRGFTRGRILIVSSSPTYTQSLKRELEAENYEIKTAGDEREIGGPNAPGGFDTVLIDCGWRPGAPEGRTRIAEMRSRVGSSPAILLLADRESKQEMMGWLEAGADDYLAKSVDPALLRARVRALLRRKSLLDENRRIAEELAEQQMQAMQARAEKQAAELRATMADRLEAANRELEGANRKLKRALAVTKAITDNAAEALLLIDAQGRVDFVSPAAARIFGFTPDELLGQSFHMMLHHHYPDGRPFPVAECPGMHALERGAGFQAHDDVFFRKDGTPVDVAYSISPVAAEGVVTGAVAVVHDVSERKRAEERLRRAQELEHIGLLAGGIAHDFNNLLVGVLGNASLAADLLPNGHPVQEMLSGIVKSGEVAAHLTRQLLAYAGKGAFVLQPVNLSAMARDARLLIERSISKKITFNLQLDPNLPPVESDPSQIQQVLMNLVLNAAEAIGDNVGMVTIATGAAEISGERLRHEFPDTALEPGCYVFVEVRDTGAGMDTPTRSRIFEPFFTTKFQGRGLGLAAVAGVVRGRKGTIQVESAPGKGSTFRVWLPAMGRPATPETAAPANLEDLHGSGMVLVVDDEVMVRDLARRALQRLGYDVLTAGTGTAAVEILRKHVKEVRAVVLDLSMPGLSGQQTLAQLRELRPDISVLVSSGYSESEALRPFRSAEISGFMQKPYTVTELAQKLTQVLKNA